MPFPGYAPPNYTAFEVMSEADWADIDILE